MSLPLTHATGQPLEEVYRSPETPIARSPFTARLELATELEEEELAALAGLCERTREVPAKRYIYREGDRLESFPVLLSGWAARYQILRNGSRQITSVVLPGEFCHHDVPPLSETPEEMITLSPCTVASVPYSEAEELTRRMPSIARAFYRYGAFQRATLASSIVSIGRRDALERTAHFICEICRRLEVVGLGAGNRFEFPLTQEDLADALGLTPVHTNRKLQQLRQDKYIALRSKELQILDRYGLERLAGFDAGYLYSQDGASPRHSN